MSNREKKKTKGFNLLTSFKRRKQSKLTSTIGEVDIEKIEKQDFTVTSITAK